MIRNSGLEGPAANDLETVALGDGGFASIIYEPGKPGGPYAKIEIFGADRQFDRTIDLAAPAWQVSISSLDTGGFVASWAGYPSGAVQAQIYDSSGTAVSAPLTIASAPPSDSASAVFTDIGGGQFAEIHADPTTWQLEGTIRDSTTGSVLHSFIVDSTSTQAYAFQELVKIDGGFVASWNNSAGQAVYQVFDTAGASVTAQMTFDPHPGLTEDYALHHMASLPGGGFAIALGLRDLVGNTHILLQSFNADGTKIADAVEVPNALLGGPGDAYDLVVTPTGNLQIIWSGSDSGSGSGVDVYVQEFHQDGTVASAAVDLSLHHGYNLMPHAAVLADGTTEIVWTSQKMAGLEWTTVGVPTTSPTVSIADGNSSVTLNPYEAKAVGLESGGFATVMYLPALSGSSINTGQVGFQLVDATGTAIGFTSLANHAYDLDATSLAAGGFVASWEDYSSPGLYANVLSASGSSATGNILIASSGHDLRIADAGNGNFAEIHSDASGHLVGSIRDLSNGSTVNSFSVSNAGSGLELTSISGGFAGIWSEAGKVMIETFDGSGTLKTTTPITLTQADMVVNHIATLHNGGFVASWETVDGSGTERIEFQTFDAQGHAASSAGHLDVATLSSGFNSYDISEFANGELLVSYSYEVASTSLVAAQIFEPDGAPVGGLIPLSASGTYNQLPTTATLADGHMAVAWNSGVAGTLTWKILGLDPASPTYGSSTAMSGGSLSGTHPEDIVTVATGGGGYAAVMYDDQIADPNPHITFQLFNSSADPVGGLHTVSSNGWTFKATGLSTGDFAVTWGSYSGVDVEGQIFHADGTAGATFAIDSPYDRNAVPIADIGNGHFVEVHNNADTYHLEGSIRDDVTGDVVNNFTLYGGTASSTSYLDIEKRGTGFAAAFFDDNGKFVVQTFDGTGAPITPLSNEILTIPQYTTPHLAVMADDTMAVLYATYSPGAYHLYGQILSATGQAVGTAFQVDTDAALTLYGDAFDLTVDHDGKLVAMWSGAHGNAAITYMRTFDTDGTPLTDTKMIGDAGDTYDFFPDSTLLQNGKTAVVYGSSFVNGIEWALV